MNQRILSHKRPGRAIVIGAGVTGLTVAWQLAASGMHTLSLEAADHPGGMAATFRHGDFLFDLGPHKFFSVMEERMALAKEIMGGDFVEVPKRSRICLAGRFLNYPLGLLDVMRNLDPFIALSAGFSYLLQLLRNPFDRRPDLSYEDWLVRRFGRRLYDLIFAEYARKIWGDPRRLARQLAETRVAIPGLLPLLWHMLIARRKGPLIHAETFFYPKYGSGQFCDRLAQLVVDHGGQIRYHAVVTGLSVATEGSALRLSAIQIGRDEMIVLEPDDVVVSTIPLGYLTRLLSPPPPDNVLKAAENLQTRPLILLYLILDRPSVSDDNWLFFPESRYIFNRVFEPKNFSPAMAPPEQTSLCLEIVAAEEGLWRQSDDILYQRAIVGLEETGLVERSQVRQYFTRRLKWAYPVYDLNYQENVRLILNYLDGFANLYSVGRQGGFNYVGQIDCLDIGLVTATHILHYHGKPQSTVNWAQARQRFASYIVLD